MPINKNLIPTLRIFKLDGLPEFLQKYKPENLVVLAPKGQKDWEIVVKTQSEVDSSEFYEEVVGSVEEMLQWMQDNTV